MKRIFKLLIPSVLLGFLFWNIAQEWQSIFNYKDQLRFTPLILSFLALLAVYPEGAYGWYLILKKNDLKIEPYQAIRLWIISNTARYIPGTIWQFVGRIELARKEAGISRGKTLASLFTETFFILTAGVFVSILAVPFIKLSDIMGHLWILLLIFPFLLLHPAVANKIIRLVGKIVKKDFVSLDINLGAKETALIFPWFVLSFLLNGIALFFLAASIWDLRPHQFLAFSGFYALSRTLGYLSVFAPGGIGVTEVSLAYLLSTAMPLPLASAIALSYRFFLTIAELIIFLLVLKLRDPLLPALRKER